MTRSDPYRNAYGPNSSESSPNNPYRRGQHLESITPDDSVEWYLDHRRDDARTSTRQKHKYALGAFLDWAGEFELDDMNHLNGRDLMRFKTWRKRDGDLAKISLNGNLAILRRFLTFCENIDAVQPGMAERVPMPNVPDQDQISEVTPSDEEVLAIRSYYRKYEYASRRQAIFELIAEVGLRMGPVRAIDLDDFDPKGQVIDYTTDPKDKMSRGRRSKTVATASE